MNQQTNTETDRTVLNMAKLKSGPITFTLTRVSESRTKIWGISRGGHVVQDKVSPVAIEGLVRVMEREGFKLLDKQFSVE